MKKVFHEHELEDANCIFCGSDGEYKILHCFPPFNVVRCRCGLTFLKPRVREEIMLSLYDTDDYFEEYSGDGAGYELQRNSLFKTFRKLVKALRDQGVIKKDCRLLEVGCGPGLFLKAVRSYTSYAVGVDLSQKARKEAKLYCDVVYSSIYNISPKERFDLIVGLNLIEHIYDPIGFLKYLSEKLTKEGSIVLVTPYFDGFWYKLLRSKWPLFKPPEHVFFYNPLTLAKIAKMAECFSHIRTFSILHAFPLEVVIRKLGFASNFTLNSKIATLNLWFPRVILCMIATKRQRT